MNRAVYLLIGLWVLLPTVFYVMLRIEERKQERPTSKRIKFSCSCGDPQYMPEPYLHGKDRCYPAREMV